VKLVGNWNYPTAVRMGAGRILELPDACAQLGLKRPLLVTDAGLAGLPMVQSMVDTCTSAGLGIAVFADVKSNPIEANVTAGVAAYKAGNHDGVVALGGGSGLDVGKAVALMAGQSRPVWDFEDVGDWWTRADADAIPPIIAVPTTAGTGSEVGRASVLTKEDTHEKKIIFHPKLMPSIVINDPELTIGLPPGLTAATGMDALAHNLEAFCAPTYHPMAVGIALEGMRLVKDWLPRAVADGTDIEARAHMLVASSMGATAFQRGLGGIHALAHPLGGVYDAHHGTLNAVLMPYVLKANRSAIESTIEDASRYLNISGGYGGFVDWVLELRQTVATPHTLNDIGIDDQRMDEIGEMAVADPSAGTNPIQLTAAEYTDIGRCAVAGTL
jgi:hypothetical protein